MKIIAIGSRATAGSMGRPSRIFDFLQNSRKKKVHVDLKCENDNVTDVSLLKEIEKNFKSTLIKQVLKTYKQ